MGENLGNRLMEIIHPTHRTEPLFAYLFAEDHLAKGIYVESGWNVYSAEEEYYRQNVVNNGWRITKVGSLFCFRLVIQNRLAKCSNVSCIKSGSLNSI